MKAPTLIDVLLAELDEDALDALVDRLAPRLADRLRRDAPATDSWLNAAQAAKYLGISKHALYKLTSARAIPFEQEAPGCKCWFKRSELDAWRRGENGYAAKAQPRAA